MSRRPSVTNIFPIALQPAPKPEESKTRRKSVAVKPNDDSKSREKRKTSEERKPTAPIIVPPARRVSTAVTPLAQLEYEANRLKASRQHEPNLVGLPEKFRQKSCVTAPNLLEVNIPEKHRAISKSRSPSKTEMNSFTTKLQLMEPPQNNRKTSTNPDDVKKLHSLLKESYNSKKDFEMAFQPRKAGDSVKSRDSGMSSSSAEADENVVEEWRPKWQRNKAGSAQGEIKSIKGICFMENGKVAVTEEKNSRIQIFDRKRGEPIKLLDGSSTTRKMQPVGICQLPGRSFLAPTDMKRIVYFEPFIHGICEEKILEKHSHLHGLAVNSKEHLFLTDLEKKRVYTYDISGTQILTFKPDDFLRPDYVAVSEEYSMVFVSDSEQGCVYMLNMDGELLNKIGRQGSEQERLIYPLGVCCQPNGKLIVADRAQHRISTYDFRARCYEHLLTQDDLLYNPTCIATDGNKYLAVAEENHDFRLDEYKLKMLYKYRR